jgi:hypothetical protein
MKIIKTMKTLGKHYAKPTPKRWRQLGDALLGIALMGIPSTLAGHEWIGITMFGLGVIGKFLTNFFKDDDYTHVNDVIDEEDDDNEPMEI